MHAAEIIRACHHSGSAPTKGQSPRVPVGALSRSPTPTGMTRPVSPPGGSHLSTRSKHKVVP
jgi:hypothetical protein